MTKRPDARAGHERNNTLYDTWSLVHLGVGVWLGWLMMPWVALLIMVLHEPLEVLVLSPLLARFGIIYGYESMRNSLSDIFFDAVGITVGALLLTALKAPPFHLF
jgi:hypothetical protein